jgi:hypothetical protein
MSHDIDVEQDDSAPKDSELNRVRALAQRQLDLQRRVAELEGDLKRANDDLKAVREVSLPNAMVEVGMKSFELAGGGSVTVEEMIVGSLTVANKEAGFAWLEDHGHGAIIKHEIKISFGRDEDTWAKKFLRDLAQRKKPLKFERKDTIAPQTLQAFIREQIANAMKENLDPKVAIPHDVFGVTTLRFAKVVDPQAAQAKKKQKAGSEESL